MILSLSTGGLAPEEISAHLAYAYGATVSAERINAILEREVAGLDAWLDRRLDPVYPVLFVDAVNVMTGARAADGRTAAGRRIHVVFAVTMIGRRDILGLWDGGAAGSDADYWLDLLGGIRGRGVADVCIVASCEDLPGLAEAARMTWPRAISSEGVIPLIRRACRYAAGDASAAREVRSVCMAATPEGAAARLAKLLETWQQRCPSMVALWRKAWPGFAEFLRLDVEIRRVICRIEAIEAVTSRIVRAVRTRFPDSRAALKPAYLAVLSLEPSDGGRRQWTTRWKPAQSALIAAFPDRLGPGTSIEAGISAN
jgi:transposase-like protein